MPFLPPNQQRQSTEGKALKAIYVHYVIFLLHNQMMTQEQF